MSRELSIIHERGRASANGWNDLHAWEYIQAMTDKRIWDSNVDSANTFKASAPDVTPWQSSIAHLGLNPHRRFSKNYLRYIFVPMQDVPLHHDIDWIKITTLSHLDSAISFLFRRVVRRRAVDSINLKLWSYEACLSQSAGTKQVEGQHYSVTSIQHDEARLIDAYEQYSLLKHDKLISPKLDFRSVLQCFCTLCR